MLMMMAMATAVSAALMPMANSVKKNPSSCSGEQEAVEYHEIDVHRIEYQLDADKHRQQVAARDEPVDAHEHHDRGDDQVIFHVYHSRIFLRAMQRSADDAGQQQDADDFERQEVTVFVRGSSAVADGLDVQFQPCSKCGAAVKSCRSDQPRGRCHAHGAPSPTKSL